MKKVTFTGVRAARRRSRSRARRRRCCSATSSPAPSLDLSKWRPNWVGTTDAAISKPVNTAEQGCYDPRQVSVSGGYLRLNAVARSCTRDERCDVPVRVRSGADEGPLHVHLRSGRGADLDAAGRGRDPELACVLDRRHRSPSEDRRDGCGRGHRGSGVLPLPLAPAGAPGGCATAANPAGWHTYAADWRAGVVTYFYDGVQVGRITQGITVGADVRRAEPRPVLDGVRPGHAAVADARRLRPRLGLNRSVQDSRDVLPRQRLVRRGARPEARAPARP